MNPKFSIVIPTYNHANYLGEAISSALSQSYEDFEIIICNDGSTDNTNEVIKSFNSSKIISFEKPNDGTVSALNSCILMARGEYICWLSSDDIFGQDKLLTHYDFHKSNPDCKFSLASFGEIIGEGVKHFHYEDIKDEFLLTKFFFGNYINGLSICVKKELFCLYGVFDYRYRYGQDVHRWHQFLRFEKPGFIRCAPQSFSRLGAGHIPQMKADLFGKLDVIKILTQSCNKYGFRTILPNYLNIEFVNLNVFWVMLRLLLTPENIFFKLHLDELFYENILNCLKFQGTPSFISEILENEMMLSEIKHDIHHNFLINHLQEANNFLQMNDRVIGFYGHLRVLEEKIKDPTSRQLVSEYFEAYI